MSPKSVYIGLIKANGLFHSTRYINTKFNFTYVAFGNMKLTNNSITFIDDFLYPPIKCRPLIMLKLYSGFSNFNRIWLFDLRKRNPISGFIFPANFDIRTFSCGHMILTAQQGFCKALLKRNSNWFVTFEVLYFLNKSSVPSIAIGHAEQVFRNEINRLFLNLTIREF